MRRSCPRSDVGMRTPRGTQGYSEHASDLIDRYEAIDASDLHADVQAFIPAPPARVLDVGAGTGRDAAWLARRGHRVVAVEPTAAFRRWAREHHASLPIEWIDDGLPHLVEVVATRQTFDVVLLTAVWMHLDEHERTAAMPVLVSLLAPRGVVIMSLRHGPVPAGRVMYPVTPDETAALARRFGLEVLLDVRGRPSHVRGADPDVTWSRLVLGWR